MSDSDNQDSKTKIGRPPSEDHAPRPTAVWVRRLNDEEHATVFGYLTPAERAEVLIAAAQRKKNVLANMAKEILGLSLPA